MSDLSGLDRSFGLLPATMVPPLLDELPPSVTRPVAEDVHPHEVGFRQLRTSAEISQVVHLRSQIQLPTSALGDAGFATREKKETRSAWSGPSSASAITSARCASCR